MCAVCGEGAVELIKRVNTGLWNFLLDFLLDDAVQSSRPIEVDSNQIETLIENNQCYSMRKIADILKISKLIKLLVKMKNVSFILGKKTKQTFCPPPYYPPCFAYLHCHLGYIMRIVVKEGPHCSSAFKPIQENIATPIRGRSWYFCSQSSGP